MPSIKGYHTIGHVRDHYRKTPGQDPNLCMNSESKAAKLIIDFTNKINHIFDKSEEVCCSSLK
jgi:hypothetical protein